MIVSVLQLERSAAYSISKECATVWKYLLLVCHRLTVYPLVAEKDTSVASPYISDATTLNALHKRKTVLMAI